MLKMSKKQSFKTWISIASLEAKERFNNDVC
jgi:hypothetical protein